MLDETVVRRQNKTGEALKTTIPKAVLNLLKLKEDDTIAWSIEAIPTSKSLRVYVERAR